MTLTPERVAEIEADYSAPNSGRFTYVSNGELVELCAAWRELQRRPPPLAVPVAKQTLNGREYKCRVENGLVIPYWPDTGKDISLSEIPFVPPHTNR